MDAALMTTYPASIPGRLYLLPAAPFHRLIAPIARHRRRA